MKIILSERKLSDERIANRVDFQNNSAF